MNRLRFEELLEKHADGLATPEELEELAALLRINPDFRRELVERTKLEVELHGVLITKASANRSSVRMQAVRPLSATFPARARRRKARETSWALPLTLAAGLIFAVAIYIFRMPSGPETVAAQPIARATEAAGAILMRGEQQQPLKGGEKLLSGDRISTGSAGRFVFSYDDGTGLILKSDSIVELRDDQGGKRVLLRSGELAATIAKQPAGKPMIFETAAARATVVGTQLRLADRNGETRLEVAEGRVRLARSSDGKSIDVAAGETAVASPGRELVAVALEAKPKAVLPVAALPLVALGAPQLQENFEDGKLEGWAHGTIVPANNGSRNCIQTAAQDDASLSAIFSSVNLPLNRLPGGTRDNQWVFTVQPGSILQFDYFIESDAAGLRVQGFNNEQDDNFYFVIDRPVAGRWTTAQLRIDQFQHNDTPRRAEALKDGTHFRNLQFMAGQKAQRLQIDNVIVAPAR
jgi:hypothetical protein